MPVEDHPVHPHGIRGEGHHPKCYNSGPPEKGYWAQDGWARREMFIPLPNSGMTIGVAEPKWVFIPHTMSTKCRQILDLPECVGCSSEKDVEYIEKMRSLL